MARLSADEKDTGHRPRTGMVVNTGVANVYREAAFQSEVVTQAILGETPQVVDQQG